METNNRLKRRTLAAVKRRMEDRPGRGYSKRSAAQDQVPQRKSEHLKLIKAMKQNPQVQVRVNAGEFDKYLEKDYGPYLSSKYGVSK